MLLPYYVKPPWFCTNFCCESRLHNFCNGPQQLLSYFSHDCWRSFREPVEFNQRTIYRTYISLQGLGCIWLLSGFYTLHKSRKYCRPIIIIRTTLLLLSYPTTLLLSALFMLPTFFPRRTTVHALTCRRSDHYSTCGLILFLSLLLHSKIWLGTSVKY